MGKNIIQQARGKGSPTYRAPSFRYAGRACHPPIKDLVGKVVDLVHCQGHTAPLAHIMYNDDTDGLAIATDGIAVGQEIRIGQDATLSNNNVMPLSRIPEGTLINNIEQVPGDGGKFARASGTFGRVISKIGDKVTVILPSKKTKEFNQNCRASLGVVAGGGRTEKPMLKAGNMYHKMRATNKLYPRSAAAAMNAVDHPYGNKRTSRKAKQKPCSRNAPPGRKVGKIAARRTGRTKK